MNTGVAIAWVRKGWAYLGRGRRRELPLMRRVGGGYWIGKYAGLRGWENADFGRQDDCMLLLQWD